MALGLYFLTSNFVLRTTVNTNPQSQDSNSTSNPDSPASEPWQQLAELLQTQEDTAALRRVFPPTPQALSLIDGLAHSDVAVTPAANAVGKELSESLKGLIDHLKVFEQISRCPIIAITGLLNAGKSSLLASYLSPENRNRVLRGLSNDAGTHRFVLWLPKIWWDEPELLSTLISFLTSLFGHAPEHLSNDPEVAAMQYNGRIMSEALMRDPMNADQGSPSQLATQTNAANPLSVPLIAYDEGLNGFAPGIGRLSRHSDWICGIQFWGKYEQWKTDGLGKAGATRQHGTAMFRFCCGQQVE